MEMESSKKKSVSLPLTLTHCSDKEIAQMDGQMDIQIDKCYLNMFWLQGLIQLLLEAFNVMIYRPQRKRPDWLNMHAGQNDPY